MPMTTCACRNEKRGGHRAIQLCVGRSVTASLVSCSTKRTIAEFERVCENLRMSIEGAPEFCPNRHPLIGGSCLVGWEVCACPQAENGGHRTHYCRQCGETIRTPPCVKPMPQTDRWTNKPARIPPPSADNDYPHL